MKTILFILLSGLLLSCDEPSPTSRAKPVREDVKNNFTVGIGDQSFELDQCVVRKGINPKRIQIVAQNTNSLPRMHLEFPFAGGNPMLNENMSPSLFVLSLTTPLASDEDKTYQNKDIQIILTHMNDSEVKGRIKGRVADLLLGRPHEMRARFTCALDQ
jgi:hypothetical protein